MTMNADGPTPRVNEDAFQGRTSPASHGRPVRIDQLPVYTASSLTMYTDIYEKAATGHTWSKSKRPSCPGLQAVQKPKAKGK
jgi:hypothetical protein